MLDKFFCFYIEIRQLFTNEYRPDMSIYRFVIIASYLFRSESIYSDCRNNYTQFLVRNNKCINIYRQYFDGISDCRNIHTQWYSNKKKQGNKKETNNKRIDARKRAFCLFFLS